MVFTPGKNGWTVAPRSHGDTQDTFDAGDALQLPPDRTERLPGNLPQRVASPTYGNNVLVWWFGCSNQYLMENSVQIEFPRVSHDVPIYLLYMVLDFAVAQWCPYLKLVNNPIII